MLFEKAKQYEKASFKGLYNFINFIDKVKTSSSDLSAAKIIGENDDVVRIMSIHKSKGLEFPVVFLSSTGKKFNMKDLNTPILLHQDIGFGPQYIDQERKIEYSTLAKEAIKIISKRETISEEMRVLYVALTRAKEKLIITGLSKDLEKGFSDKSKMLSMVRKEKKNVKINENVVEKYRSYLDWIELVYQYNIDNGIGNILDLHVYDKIKLQKDLQKQENEANSAEELIKSKALTTVKKEEMRNIEEKLEWKYKYLESSKIPTKTSVTKIKELEMDNDIEDLIQMARSKEKMLTSLTAMPSFMEEEQRLSSAQKGTLIHLCVQKLDEKKDYSKDDLKEFVEDLYKKNIISQIEAKNINIDILYKYTKSELWNDLKEAKEIHKEEPFYINIPAQKIYDGAEENEMILVQGIIDLYYINKDGKLILVDYKTDHVPDGDINKLNEKYKVQLDLYKEALENAIGKRIDKAMIWALNL